MSARLMAVLLCGAASTAGAETSWLASTARLEAAQRYELFGGPNAVGAGAQWQLGVATRALSVEASWALFMRYADARIDHLWLLRRGDRVCVSAAIGGDLVVVPGPFDVGLGPHGALTVSIGRRAVSLQLGLQTGAQVFARSFGPRFEERLFVGVTGAVGPLGWGLLARSGVDLEPGQPFVGRADAVLALSWLRQ